MTEDDEKLGLDADDWRELRKQSQEKRAKNRKSSAQLLDEEGIGYIEFNWGQHLVLDTPFDAIDFWPGTGRWKTRKGKTTGFGVRNLIKFYKEQLP